MPERRAMYAELHLYIDGQREAVGEVTNCAEHSVYRF